MTSSTRTDPFAKTVEEQRENESVHNDDGGLKSTLDASAAVGSVLNAAAAPKMPAVQPIAKGVHKSNIAIRSTVDAGAAPSVPIEVTAHLGRYAIVRKLGEGGMGSVFVGYDEALDRKVAVKVLHRGPIAEQWLLREAQALAKLSHPNVVHVFEVGHHEGRVFLAMEYIEGVTLREHIARENKPFLELAATFLQAGRGLCAAHNAGLVHRDFKPDNVLVGADGRVRVVDFGIAALADRDALEPTNQVLSERALGASPSALHSPLTRAGAVLGTPAFMSPEQFRGERATPASDQFSFCVALYEAAYGSSPFAGETVRELSENVKAGRLQPPPKQSNAPDWLAAVVTRGLSGKPDDRYPTLTALLDDIESHLPKGPAEPSVRREQIFLGVVLGVVSLGITGSLALQKGPITDHRLYLAMGILMAIVACTVVATLWRRLRMSTRGRTIAAILVGVSVVLVGQRLILVALSIPVLFALVLDCYLLFIAFSIGTLFLEKRLWPLLILGVGALAAMVSVPERAQFGIGIFSVVSLGAVAVTWDRKKEG
ncbi:MAG: serine/threonine protein kinase [Polyangiaceae bacterium]|nr:serine/threonine protein kinase [Polyangiaceae bacterium]